ncbi:39_t:CDS:2 [Acaulospora colombiana]|uniref:39_t:CDS:1 n=1 Tax=Acaulospora colombiana TaxID=27376 RepID=A0ACA9L3V3_9GLOM|nr:39_t:CDS:2 [Acaulospora colombiana]
MVSKWVGDAFGKEGIYDGWIRINEYPFLDSKEEYVYNTLASDVMTFVEDLVIITATGHTLDGLGRVATFKASSEYDGCGLVFSDVTILLFQEELLNETDYKGFPVGLRYVLVTKNGQLLGLITKKDVLRHLAAINHPGSLMNRVYSQEVQNLMILPERRRSSFTRDFGTD